MEIRWTEEDVIEELVEEFGEEYRDDIERTLSLTKGKWAKWGLCGSVKIGRFRYTIIKDENEAVEIAKAVVIQYLDEEPETFSESFLRDYIYITETDKRLLIADEEVYIRDEVETEAEDMDFETEEAKKRWIEEEVDKRIEEFKKGLEDPVEYFVYELGLYTFEELLKQPWIRIDYDRAAEQAVVLDGWEHFLTDDGKSYVTKNGLVYFREY